MSVIGVEPVPSARGARRAAALGYDRVVATSRRPRARLRERTARPPRAAVAVDWSGALVGAETRLWLAEARAEGVVRVECGRDRDATIAHLIELAAREPRLVVGFDFAFSFPRWFLAELGVASARELWDLVAREGETWLERCAPPFWGKPGSRRPPDDGARPSWRATESEAARVGGIGPKPVFQIGGAGSVGTGSLRGMPALARLQDAGFSIWPFDPPRMPVALEIYPRYLTGAVNKSSAVARALYLEAHHARERRELLAIAGRSEDAFDAFVSAACMRRFARNLARLDRRRSADDRLEGRIWRPIRDPIFERW